MAATVRNKRAGEPKTFWIGGLQPTWAVLAVLIVAVAGVLTSLQEPDPQPLSKPGFYEIFRSSPALIRWLRYPLERNAGLRLPAAPSGLLDIAGSSDGTKVLAVGAGGTILLSNDGGKSWTAQDSGVTATLKSIYCNRDCSAAWAVGFDAIVHTTNGGRNWSAQRIGVGTDLAVSLNAVIFDQSAIKGWIVGNDGLILTTPNGGRDWHLQSPPTSHNLFSVAVDRSGSKIWAAGAEGVIFESVDGGRNWESEASGTPNALSSITFADNGKDGFAIGIDNTLLSTHDGGAHWHDLSHSKALTDSKDAGYYPTVAFATKDRVCATLPNGQILCSPDSGRSWLKEQSGVYSPLNAISFARNGKVGWVAGAGGTIIATSDGGESWRTQVSGNSTKLFDVHFDSAGNTGWAVGGLGTILSTTDGGDHWSVRRVAPYKDLNSVFFTTANETGWAVGDEGTILVTHNGGVSWQIQQSGTRAALNDLYFEEDGEHGWVAAQNGTVLATNDGGRSWTTQVVDKDRQLHSVTFAPGGLHGWTVGDAVYVTTNGGRSWSVNYLVKHLLRGLWFDPLHRLGWAVGDEGTIIHTADGGRVWVKQRSTTDASLTSVQFESKGERGWATGAAGTILLTRDGGTSWQHADSTAGSSRGAIAMTAGGRGWVVGYAPSLLRTRDGGVHWDPIPWPESYRRYPAPWFWLVLALATGVLVLSWRTKSRGAVGIESVGITDAPVDNFDSDRLQFGPLARGISRFLRNINTRPPLTLAIAGDWGSGKSTLMKLVCADLRRYGTRPIWFNAWHHQSEEQILAALLKEVQLTGIPSIWSVDGLAFRLRLLLIRSKQHFAVAMIMLALSAGLVGFLMSHGLSEWSRLWDSARHLAEYLSQTKDTINGGTKLTLSDTGRLIPQMIGGLAAIVSLSRGLRAFDVDPAVLLARTTERFSLKAASAQTSFRSKFARQFDEVTRALPYTMVIVIDDLDRCQPETVLTVMETVNFLVSSGKCFVLFGMATFRVQAALALMFERISDQLESPHQVGDGRTDRRQQLHLRRLEYASDYLDKLINIEILVPRREDIPPDHLIAGPVSVAPYRSFLEKVLEFGPIALATVAVGVGLVVGVLYSFSPPAEPTIERGKPIEASAPPAQPSSAPGPDTIVTDVAPITPYSITYSRYVPSVQQNTHTVADNWTVLIVFIFFTGVATAIVVFQLRRLASQVSDSESFETALRVWLPLVRLKRHTPRGIKRFVNRLRYLAMLQQPESLDDSGFELFKQRVLEFARIVLGQKADAAYRQREVPEPVLVALASVNDAYGEKWQDSLEPSADTSVGIKLREAVASSRELTNFSWPPRTRDLEAFTRLLAGIKIGAETVDLVAGAP